MKTLIVYDSFFGNTERIAQAISQALGYIELEIYKASDVKPEFLKDVRLLIVGSPTRGFRPTKPVTDFLKLIPEQGLKGVSVAAFDTRLAVADVNSRVLSVLVKVFGYAAEPIDAKLVKKGGNRITLPVGFIVKDSEGPLLDGELERAVDWVKNAIKEL